MEGFDQQRFELLKVGHGADSKTLLYENITEALTEVGTRFNVDAGTR